MNSLDYLFELAKVLSHSKLNDKGEYPLKLFKFFGKLKNAEV